MAAKRIRCICGKVYDPGEHPRCPDCGTEVLIESISIVAPNPAASPAATASVAPPAANDIRPAAAAKPIPWLWIGGGVWLTAVITVAAIHFLKPQTPPVVVAQNEPTGDKPAGTHDKPVTVVPPQPSVNPPLKEQPAPGSQTSTPPEPAIVPADKKDSGGPLPGNQGNPGTAQEPKPEPKSETPAEPKERAPKQWIVESKGSVEESGAALADTLSKAGDGDTIIVRGPLFFASDIKITRPVHLVGDAKTAVLPVLKADKTACLTISSKGVTIEKFTILQTSQESGSSALRMEMGAELALIDCKVVAGGKNGVIGDGPASLTATGCSFAGPADTPGSMLVAVRGPSHIQFTKCDFAGGESGIGAAEETVGELRNCTFHNVGAKNGEGTIVLVSGENSRITADKCEFTGNRAGLKAETKASLAVTNGTFTDNGVGFEKGNTTKGLIAATSGARAVVIGSTFKGNRQGMQAWSGGNLEVADCHFTSNGIKIVTADANESNPAVNFLCLPLTVAGQGSTATVSRTEFVQSFSNAIHVLDGGSLTLEDSDINGTGDTAIIIGQAEKAPARADVKRTRVNRNPRGIQVVAGGYAIIEGGEYLQNGIGLSAEDAGTRLHLSKVTISENKEIAFYGQAGAEIVATDCIIQNNMRGAQAGRPGKPELAATATLENCKLLENQTFDALACEKSTVALKNCAFAPDGKPKVSREKDGIIQAEPPIANIASGKTVPVQKGKQTASNNTNKPPVKRPVPQRYAPYPPQQPAGIPDDVNRAIDAVNTLRRLFR